MERADSYRAIRFQSYRVDETLALLHSLEHHRVIACPQDLVRILENWQGCRPLETYVENAVRVGQVANAAAIRLQLLSLVRSGLLQPWKGHPRPTTVRWSASPHSSIDLVAVVTANRPAFLARCLTSLLGHFERHGRKPQLLVVDGSTTRAHVAANRRLVLCMSKTHRVRIVSSHDARSVDRWIRCKVDAPEARSLTTGSIGANRNLVLLLAAGANVLMVDDDVVCEPWLRPDSVDTLTLLGHTEERYVRFFATRKDAVSAAGRADLDLLAAHERVLDAELSALAERCRTPPDFAKACDHLLGALEAARPLATRVTLTGLAGDSAMSCPDRLLFTSGSLRARIADCETCYTKAMTYREVHRIADRVLVTHDPHCMAYCTGFANRHLLPPFMPSGRNEDGVFGVLLTRCDPDALLAHVPCGIIHDSSRPAAYGDAPHSFALQTRMAELLIELVRQCAMPPIAAMSCSQRLAAIGSALADVGKLGGDDFQVHATQALLDARQRELRWIEVALADSGWPRHLRDALRRYRLDLLSSIRRPDFFVPTECPPHGTVRERFRRVQASVACFGRLLRLWPQLWQDAADSWADNMRRWERRGTATPTQ